MKLDDRLEMYQSEVRKEIENQAEWKIEKCIKNATETYVLEEEKKHLSYYEFLWIQSAFIQKKWWILQAVFMLVVWIGLTILGSPEVTKRGLGVSGTLFIIMMIPEVWKNEMNTATEIEGSCFYTLRQIYSARLLLFFMVDTVILSIFCISGFWAWNMEVKDMMIHCMIPMTVTAGICFGTFCSKHFAHEGIAIIFCFLWSGVWSIIVMNHKLYMCIDDSVWITVLILSVLYLAYSVYRVVQGSGKRLEVQTYGIDI